MGVPKFFRYTSERYPCLNELVKQYQIPDFDNMYLDMNGIIHNCSHPDDSDPHFRITEEKIFTDIFHYLSVLFQIIKPKKLFFMAIDGVAPRAKMNQQRGRRFRSAREAEKLEEEAKAKGETLPTEKRFDSNCITPGTVFMARLHEQLKYFVKQKMSTDPLWAKVKVILSGHETPGEGEHKIMDYIRWARSQPEYDPNTRHCLYGLDADLIMLGMCTHEPHFALLREEVKFGKTTQRATSPEETNFYLLHLSLLREYLEQEFIAIRDSLPFEYDIEKIVDDWVLMGFLVGNDFIPNLPNMHISNDALPLLYKTYMTVLPTLDGYINEAGDLHLGRFEKFMQELAKIDREKFQDTYADLKYFEGKTGRRPNANERREYKPNNEDTFNVNIDDIKANEPDDELQALISATQEMFFDDVGDDGEFEDIDSSDEEANFNMEFVLHKKDYYMNKLDYSKVTNEVLASQAECYVRAIQWNLYYYYRGCASWCWYYPHHYAPYISDIKDFAHLDLQFELGEPFKPFEQLLAVLPAASKHLLPAPFHELMTDEDSPIVHYYPVHFETDLNGKRNDWEAVVLIPFIDETNLLSAMTPCYQRLTDEERNRNTHGPMMVYNWSQESQGTAEAPEYFSPIRVCHAVEREIFRQELEVPLAQLKRGMLPNASRDLVFPGFPTMRHLKYRTSIKKNKVKVFDQPSRGENMMIELIRETEVDPVLENVAQNLLGKVIWVGWPHLTKAKVISVSNEKQRLHHNDSQNNNATGAPRYSVELNKDNLHKQWISERSTIIEHNMGRLGIELGDVKIIVHATNLRGYKYIIQDNTQMVLEPEWCSVPCGYALQAIVCNVDAYVADVSTKFATPQEAYPPGENVFLLTVGQYYGCLAKVVDSESIRSGRIKVQVSECDEPTPSTQGAATPYRTAHHAAASCVNLNSCPIKVQVSECDEPTPSTQGAATPYRTAHHAAASCGISTQILSRITGCIFVVPGERNDLPTEQVAKLNIGLNLKFNKKNLEVSGFTRRCALTGSWLYSARCVELVSHYVQQFPDLFDCIAHSLGNDIFFESELFPGEVGKGKPQEIVTWLKAQPHQTAVKRECGSEALEPEEMLVLAKSLDQQLAQLQDKQKSVTLHVKWNLLYKPDLHEGNLNPDQKADFKICDRVVCVAKNMTVPLGAKGTVTAIYKPGQSNTVRLSDKLNAEASYQVLFDEPFPGALKEELFEVARHYRMQPSSILNISFGRKLRDAASSANVDNAFMYAKTPNVLRREDGHHSAFASYSPTKDRQTPGVEPRNNVTPKILSNSATPKIANNSGTPNIPIDPSQDSSTMLLKSLLKISQDDSDAKKSNKSAKPESPQNWRAKSETSQPPVPSPQKPQLVNWRQENSASFNNNNRMQPPIPTEWTNKNIKAQPPVPPFPTFGQPSFAGPQPGQIPFPHFQNPHFQQRNHANHDNYQRTPNNHQNNQKTESNQPFRSQNPPFANQNSHQPNNGPFVNQSNDNQAPFGNQNQLNRSFSQNGQFPKSLPGVGPNVTLGPAWNNVPASSTPEQVVSKPSNAPAEKTTKSNPFVPLQVVASQRRVQNPGGPHKKHRAEQEPQPAPAQPPQSAGHPQNPHQANHQTSRPQRKKKPRIAANLPFQMD